MMYEFFSPLWSSFVFWFIWMEVLAFALLVESFWVQEVTVCISISMTTVSTQIIYLVLESFKSSFKQTGTYCALTFNIYFVYVYIYYLKCLDLYIYHSWFYQSVGVQQSVIQQSDYITQQSSEAASIEWNMETALYCWRGMDTSGLQLLWKDNEMKQVVA